MTQEQLIAAGMMAPPGGASGSLPRVGELEVPQLKPAGGPATAAYAADVAAIGSTDGGLVAPHSWGAASSWGEDDTSLLMCGGGGAPSGSASSLSMGQQLPRSVSLSTASGQLQLLHAGSADMSVSSGTLPTTGTTYGSHTQMDAHMARVQAAGGAPALMLLQPMSLDAQHHSALHSAQPPSAQLHRASSMESPSFGALGPVPSAGMGGGFALPQGGANMQAAHHTSHVQRQQQQQQQRHMQQQAQRQGQQQLLHLAAASPGSTGTLPVLTSSLAQQHQQALQQQQQQHQQVQIHNHRVRATPVRQQPQAMHIGGTVAQSLALPLAASAQLQSPLQCRSGAFAAPMGAPDSQSSASEETLLSTGGGLPRSTSGMPLAPCGTAAVMATASEASSISNAYTAASGSFAVKAPMTTGGAVPASSAASMAAPLAAVYAPSPPPPPAGVLQLHALTLQLQELSDAAAAAGGATPGSGAPGDEGRGVSGMDSGSGNRLQIVQALASALQKELSSLAVGNTGDPAPACGQGYTQSHCT